MSEKKPGIIRRFFRFIGNIVTGIRYLFSLLFVGLFLMVIVGMFAEDIQPIPDKGALYLAPSGVLVDQKTYTDPFDQIFMGNSQQDSETLVRDVIEALDTARIDSRITHLLLDTDYMAGGGISKLEEISTALLRFKKSGKPIIAVGDSFNQQQYFLAAHADEILLNPLGSVSITGFGLYNSYFKEALDKLNINMHIFRVGDYKSAVEPFLRNNMSANVKQESRELVDSLWQFYSSQVEHLRGLPDGAIDDFANNLHLKLQAANGDTSALAKQQNLVDQIATRTQMFAYLNEVLPGTDGEFDSINMQAYLNHNRLTSRTSAAAKAHKVALVVAKGSIVDGEQPEGTIGGDTLASIFARLRDEDEVKAVVLRIDSGGGSAFASDIIRDAISATQQKGIPVVVSMGSYAASGGYWIAADADRVLALSTTLTGSIGVFGIVPTVEDSLAALGVYSDGVGTTDIAGMMRLDRPMTQQSKMIFQAGVDNIYTRFISLVADGRNSTPAAVHEIAQGRVWTGEKALALGLVDQLGDLNDAIKVAAELANLAEYEVDYRRKPLTVYEQLLMEMSSNISASVAGLGLKSWLPNSLREQAQVILKPLQVLDTLTDPRGIYLYCESCPL
ncbi:signal peptide peptidase SppA [bacterium]|nr:signal peptide peptidase SppA [Porticoccaceae bacterium]MDB4076374.1 signal peptide peptidase SppA [Porticoccaceae bacterium]MDB9814630.1 signal peptide peptidase SppA [bacterium]MDB9953140.1 signal peptide peptidase SppA [Porticoccaceae bacterium]